MVCTLAKYGCRGLAWGRQPVGSGSGEFLDAYRVCALVEYGCHNLTCGRANKRVLFGRNLFFAQG